MANFVQKFKDILTSPEDEYDEYDYEYDYQDEDDHDDRNESRKESRHSSSNQGNNKVVNIHATAKLQVVLFKPERFGEETRTIADELLKIHTIVLNLENTNNETARRIIDFLSGVTYANGGKIKKVATGTYVITPYNVDLTGEDFLDELENSGVYF